MSLHSLRELKLTKAVALYNRDQQPEYQRQFSVCIYSNVYKIILVCRVAGRSHCTYRQGCRY